MLMRTTEILAVGIYLLLAEMSNTHESYYQEAKENR